MNAQPSSDLPERRPFAAWLTEQRGGGLHGELSDSLAEVVSAALTHQKAGQVTLTVTVNPNDDGVSCFIADQVKTKVPEADRPQSLFFADERGNLARRDPRQAELPLREVAGGKSDDDTDRKAASK